MITALLGLALSQPAIATGFVSSKVADDGHGNTYVIGHLQADGSDELVVTKLDESGEASWTRILSDHTFGDDVALAVDTKGRLIVSGTYRGALDLGDVNYADTESGDLFVAKFDAGGDLLWSHRMAGPNQSSVPIDETGTLSVTLLGGGWGRVWVNHELLSMTAPFRSHPLPEGDYEVVVENPILGTQFTEKVRVRPGEKTIVQVKPAG